MKIKAIKFVLVAGMMYLASAVSAYSGGICSFIGSDNGCQNVAIGSLCDANGTEGVCVPKNHFGNTYECACVPGKAPKVHKCKAGYRWSPVKNQCIKPMGSSPDGSVQCIPPYYWYAPDNNCEILFSE